MQKSSLGILCNPYSGELLRIDGDFLVGTTSGQRFPIRDGIPSFLAGKSIPLRNRFWRWLYDVMAFGYDPVMSLGTKFHYGNESKVRRDFISSIPIFPGDKVLETSIGTAANNPYLPDQAAYYGVDISWGMLRQAKVKLKKWGRHTELFHADGEHLPFHDNSFDTVLHMGGLQFYNDPFQGMREMARVAKVGTKIIVIDEVRGARKILRRSPAHGKAVKNNKTAFQELWRLAPRGAKNMHVEELGEGQFYALTVIK